MATFLTGSWFLAAVTMSDDLDEYHYPAAGIFSVGGGMMAQTVFLMLMDGRRNTAAGGTRCGAQVRAPPPSGFVI